MLEILKVANPRLFTCWEDEVCHAGGISVFAVGELTFAVQYAPDFQNEKARYTIFTDNKAQLTEHIKDLCKNPSNASIEGMLNDVMEHRGVISRLVSCDRVEGC